MGLLFESNVTELLAVAAAIWIGVVTYFKWMFTYWEKRNLPHPKPSFPFGNMQNPLHQEDAPGVYLKALYDSMKQLGHKHVGLYNFAFPVYMPIDPEYVKNVIQQDFHHFTDRGIYYNEKADPLTAHLFALGGAKWRHIRTKLTPTFTSGKMKMMFNTLVQCAIPMQKVMDLLVEREMSIDIKEVVARFTTDIIGTCAFGLECNSFKSEDADFRKHGRKIFEQSMLKTIRRAVLLAKPELGEALGIKTVPKETADFFMGVIKDALRYRETNNVVRKDMLQLLIDLKNDKREGADPNEGKPLTIEEVAAQAFVFFVAGYETSSTTMTFCLFELARQPELQHKVRKEINRVLKKYNNEITYEAMVDMKYMGQVIDETLRKHPPATIVTRKCVQDYKVPNTDVMIEKGTTVFIPILALHRDPEFYPDPDRFDPERFSDDERKTVQPFTYMPFGEGPRICIGLRFAVMQMKVGLTTLLKNYQFSLSSKTKTPFKVNPHTAVYSSQETIWLNAKRIE